MNKRHRLSVLCVLLAVLSSDAACLHAAPAVVPSAAVTADGSTTETIILIRHGEKTPSELGQLDLLGLNRALALPDVLIGKYGKPDYLFAPNPSGQITAKTGDLYSYVRPLATIEPTAIRLGMPVNAQIAFFDIKQLQAELTKPIYANSLIFVAWEHLAEDQFAKNMMVAYGKDASVVPYWPGKDYDSIFVIRLMHSSTATTATFTVDHEGLNGKLGTGYPVVEPTAGVTTASPTGTPPFPVPPPVQPTPTAPPAQ